MERNVFLKMMRMDFLEIIKRLGIKKGVFAELEPGNGTENNTICLAALKWKGFG